MPFLEIQKLSGELEYVEISKTLPVSIGRHSTNDVVIDEHWVGSLHCRISWNKHAFQVAAANADGVELNGRLVHHGDLTYGDVIRVGSFDMKLLEEKPVIPEATREVSLLDYLDVEHQPNSAEEVQIRKIALAPPPPTSKPRQPKGESNVPGDLDPVELLPQQTGEFERPLPDWESEMRAPALNPTRVPEKEPQIPKRELDQPLPPLKREPAPSSRKEQEPPPPRKEPAPAHAKPEQAHAKPEPVHSAAKKEKRSEVRTEPSPSRDAPVSAEYDVIEIAAADTYRATARKPVEIERPSMGARLAARMGAAPVRPGEQEVFRSPLVLILGGGTFALVLAALTLWFVIGREAASEKYSRAIAALDARQYPQAISMFEEFLKQYPRHKLVPAARGNVGIARIRLAISGGVPAWQDGLAALETFIERNRSSSEYASLRPAVRHLAEEIALGAATTAASTNDRSLLDVTRTAKTILEVQSSEDQQPTDLLQRIQDAIGQADAAILRNETYQDTLAQVDLALEERRPLEILDARRKLLVRYPDFEGDRGIRDRTARAMEIEKELIAHESVLPQPLRDDRPKSAPRPVTLAKQTRVPSEAAQSNATLFTIADGAVFAVDSASGTPTWRRELGLDTPFFPVPVETDVQAALLFDTRYGELLLVQQRTGDLIWRLPLSEAREQAAGPPLVHAGQIFLVTLTGRLYQVDLDSGRVIDVLKFPQPVQASPTLVADGDRLAVIGKQGVVYTLTYRPLECSVVTHLGHAAGAIRTPLLKMGDFLLAAENDRQDSCRLSVWFAATPEKPLELVTSHRIKGHVRDLPALRGKQLFVPSSDERIWAFMISDEKGPGVMAPIASYQVNPAHGGPMQIAIGSDDDLWMASSAVRRFKLETDRIVPQQKSVPPGKSQLGVCAQPVRVVDQSIFAGFNWPHSSATFLIAADRRQMIGEWQLVLGAGVLETTRQSPPADGAICVTDTGDIHNVSLQRLREGGFDARPLASLNLPDGMTGSLRAARLDDGRIAIDCTEPQSRLWLVDASGRIEREVKLSEPLQARPILLGEGLLLPLPGKLRLIDSRTGAKSAEDLLAPVGQQPAAPWMLVARIDDKHAVAMTASGRLTRVQFRTEPMPHLSEVAHVDLEGPLDLMPAVADGRICAVVGQRLKLLDALTLNELAEQPIAQPAAQSPWIVGRKVYVSLGREQLCCYDLAEPLRESWKLPIRDCALAGPPLPWKQGLLVALLDGRLLLVDETEGKVTREIPAIQPIRFGPRSLQDAAFVSTVDGSLQLLNPLLESVE